MKFQLKQKLLAFGNDFLIKGEDGEDLFFVDGKAFSFGQQLSFQNMHKKELAFISQRLFTFRPTYRISSRGDTLAVVRKKLISFRPAFVVDVPGPSDYTVQGSFLEYDYRFTRDGKDIARVSKRFFRATDTYGIDLFDSNAMLIVLCSAVVIDLICHGKQGKK